ncbi:hypothetical protein DVA86_26610 [Streptomyces armeniacus]|uniref:PPM-type phosphatase domain-containing protein n=2 Tax=Streptomyces armeniacus TaxID=83291 RepID=A0A345XVL0_9ACTN|nr:ATP-binding SpoIIE family protein phosphatase [Streptomyces armeniacus]AXK35676.1 hypothetical protein DVA86_26610 [Streptomyces armeniacus]
MSLSANQLAPSRARGFVRAVLEAAPRAAAGASTGAGTGAGTGPGSAGVRKVPDALVDDALLLVSELVTNALVHAGTDIDVTCALEPGPPVRVLIEVADRHTDGHLHRHTGSAGGGDADEPQEGRFGLPLLGAVAESWGVTYRRTAKTVWFRLDPAEYGAGTAGGAPPEPVPRPVSVPEPVRAPQPVPAEPAPRPPTAAAPQEPRQLPPWTDRGGRSFLAETSELLAGQLDEDMVAVLACQLLVPRIADWCSVWLTTESGGMRLARVLHADERRIGALRHELEASAPPARSRTAGVPWPWPRSAGGGAAVNGDANGDANGDGNGGGGDGLGSRNGTGGSALTFPLIAGSGVTVGVLLLGREGQLQTTVSVARMVEDVARRVAQAVLTARQYMRQATISRALQRRQLPSFLPSIPGVDTAIVYEPHGEGQTVGGDFYDLFPKGDHRWCFLLGDVQGKDPEAMSITGLARHLVRLLAREGHSVESVLDRLNVAMAEEGAEALASSGGEKAGPRFLSLLYGELYVDPVTAATRCTVASAGHPLPLLLSADGAVRAAAEPQMLLGIDESVEFSASAFDLAAGDTLLCVTDGVTERRSGRWELDDNDGLAAVLGGCAGLGAKSVAEQVRRAAHDFGNTPIEDDLSVLVLQAVPRA